MFTFDAMQQLVDDHRNHMMSDADVARSTAATRAARTRRRGHHRRAARGAVLVATLHRS
jgi:hypothetical protein